LICPRTSFTCDDIRAAARLSEAAKRHFLVCTSFVLAFFCVHWPDVRADDASAVGRIPKVHAELLLPSPAARAWRDVQEAIRDGEELPAPDPEPYYSRAEIWAERLENQEEALLDTLRGVEALLGGKDGNDPAEIERAFKRLREAAWRSLQRPKAIYPGAAEKHFGAGLHSYAMDNFEVAAAQFSRAIQLDASHPEYYYYRSLAYLASGHRGLAINDAEKGAILESRLTKAAQADVCRSLRRVQGQHRIWLEDFRRGRPTYDPRRDSTLPERLFPDSRSLEERARIQGATNVSREPHGLPDSLFYSGYAIRLPGATGTTLRAGNLNLI
jgi:tetratricopeptide (TPR) repeat protein